MNLINMDGVKKREVSTLIPYKIENGVISVYLQKRSVNSKIYPDLFSLFGGGIEKDETVIEGLVREIKEELNFDVINYKPLGRYEFPTHINNCFISKVENDFENKVTVLEGEYGKFLTQKETLLESKISPSTKHILEVFFKSIPK